MPMTPREIIKLLETNGFQYKSANGSHQKFEKNGVVIIVPVHSGTLKKGTEQAILKQAGLK
ncbi:MAG: type II toxin-antitoxin system HicA family toxin [Firmicutes bacterium]|nr:type II toxin-antitoxin system HicA family toxin [Bacillota bacterium]